MSDEPLGSRRPVDVHHMLARFDEAWAPRVIARVNDYDVKIAKADGEFHDHTHPETDEFFLVLEGELRIALPDREVALSPGQIFVVPKGVRHRPAASEGASVLLFEPRGTLNVGDAEAEGTTGEVVQG